MRSGYLREVLSVATPAYSSCTTPNQDRRTGRRLGEMKPDLTQALDIAMVGLMQDLHHAEAIMVLDCSIPARKAQDESVMRGLYSHHDLGYPHWLESVEADPGLAIRAMQVSRTRLKAVEVFEKASYGSRRCRRCWGLACSGSEPSECRMETLLMIRYELPPVDDALGVLCGRRGVRG